MIEERIEFLRNNTTKDASSISLYDAVFGRKYRRATWTCFLVNTFNIYTGVDAVYTYATRLLINMDKASNGTFPISPMTGTWILGVVNMTFSLIAFFVIGTFGRRTLLVGGSLAMGICLISSGLSII